MPTRNDSRALSNAEAVILSLFDLGADQVAIDTEDIAVLAAKIAPGQFQWRKYPEYIDLETVRLALKDAKSRGLVAGSMKNGWVLTPTALQWAKGPAGAESKGKARVDRGNEKRRAFEAARIKNLPAFEKYASGTEVDVREAEQVFRVDVYSSSECYQRSINRIKSLFLDDTEIAEFLDAMAQVIDSRRKV